MMCFYEPYLLSIYSIQTLEAAANLQISPIANFSNKIQAFCCAIVETFSLVHGVIK